MWVNTKYKKALIYTKLDLFLTRGVHLYEEIALRISFLMC